jgi:ubiquinone/menaquinone biosynthesis C-methylase UbiE
MTSSASLRPADGDKASVHDFWQRAACGEELYLEGMDAESYRRHLATRYQLEPYIIDFADFPAAKDKDVLEIGVGLGADHLKFAEAGARLTGICLTERAIEHTGRRLAHSGHRSNLQVADAESLPFADESFDIVYSWGVIHHTPGTAKAAAEILRVLRPGGRFKVMIYHRQSIVGYMLWLRYALLRGRPRTGLDEIYARYLESPGTKAYTPAQAASLFEGTESIRTSTVLSQGDLLEGGAGQRHRGALLSAARRIWPRSLIRRFLPGHGLFLLVEGRKPAPGAAKAAE